MFEKVVEEIEKEAIKWVKDVFPNDEFKQSGISRALVEFAELGYNKCDEQLTKAKEIMREMLRILPKENIEGIYEITEEAEEFLNEVEKPIESSVDHIIEQNEKEVGLNPDYFLGGW